MDKAKSGHGGTIKEQCHGLSSSIPHTLPTMMLCLTTGAVTVDQNLSEDEGKTFPSSS